MLYQSSGHVPHKGLQKRLSESGMSAFSVAAGKLPLPYMGAVIVISRNLMLFVDAVLLCGCTIVAARPQRRLTCPAPAPTPASTTAPGPAQRAEPTPTSATPPGPVLNSEPGFSK